MRYSCTISGASEVSGPVTKVLLFSRPSSRKFDAEGRWPLLDSPKPRAVPASDVTPETNARVAYTSRPARGRFSTDFGSITTDTVDSSQLVRYGAICR